jgi:hypothetical protein
MSEGFPKKWKEIENQKSISKRLKEAVRPSKPLKPRLDLAIRRIELQIQRLDQASERARANELAEVRKMEKNDNA